MLIETVSGKLVDPENIDSTQIDIDDIAWALSRINRFSGHTTTEVPYNVAQHCVFVADMILDCGNSKKIALYGLLHDSAEIFIGDIPSPTKHIPALKAVIEPIEQRILDSIFMKYCSGCPSSEVWSTVKYFDKRAQFIEAWNFMSSRGIKWPGRENYNISLTDIQNFPTPRSSIDSYRDFINKFNKLN